MTVPPLPSWASRPTRGGPAPGSPSDQQLAAFVGPRWPTYRRKFQPFFEDPQFVPTWNWAAALLSPMWFLYRKLYVPFAFFLFAPSVAWGLLWGSPDIPTQTVPNVVPGAPPLTVLAPDAALLVSGILCSLAILAGGTANYLLFRRAQAAIRVVVPRSPSADAALPLLGRVGGVSWRAVGFGVLVLVVLQIGYRLGAM
ncbi:hypothetical protein tb265_26930 [Gemmatimonadetes bacterium T265]|nr:hypothetical protein tb265_26930 [Gemmatimonadetes bacterium T265]